MRVLWLEVEILLDEGDWLLTLLREERDEGDWLLSEESEERDEGD